jgi:hypothetical protein
MVTVVLNFLNTSGTVAEVLPVPVVEVVAESLLQEMLINAPDAKMIMGREYFFITNDFLI